MNIRQQFTAMLTAQAAPPVHTCTAAQLPKGWFFYVREFETVLQVCAGYRAKFGREPVALFVTGTRTWVPHSTQPGVDPDPLVPQ